MHEPIATLGWFSTTEGNIEGKECWGAIYANEPYLLQHTEVHLHVDKMVFFHCLRKWDGKVRPVHCLM